MKKYYLTIFSIIFFALFCLSCQASNTSGSVTASSVATYSQPAKPSETSDISAQHLSSVICNLGNNELRIELARSSAERAEGLMFIDNLAENEGMLFVYDQPHKMVFWMKNTKIPLDLIFFSQDLQITEWIKNMVPGYGLSEYSLPRYAAKYPAQYALELSAGSIERMELKLGDKLKIPLTLLHSE